ncbi:unnamed protein product [Effrenium voratum]|nr:unnamed protein product [Effrenium voratum]
MHGSFRYEISPVSMGSKTAGSSSPALRGTVARLLQPHLGPSLVQIPPSQHAASRLGARKCEQVTELLEKSSVSALVARWRARSASANPVPFGAQPVVENAERRGLAKKGFAKSKAPGLWAPVGVTLTFAAIVLQSLPK